jgi:hypothetical protein
MSDDVRIDQLRARRAAIGCTWLFLAVPGILGVVLLFTSDFTSTLAWVLTGIFLIGTGYLVYMFRRANTMPVAVAESRWFGRRKL